MARFKGTKGFLILVLLIAIVIGYYFYLSNREVEKKEMDVTVSLYDEVMMRDLEKNYPPTPKEVIKYYSLITQCFYNQDLSKEQLASLAEKSMALYDEELSANNTKDDYIVNLEGDIADFAGKNIKISTYSVSASTDVEYFTDDGYEWAKLYCMYSMRQGSEMFGVQEAFLLRKDDAGHYKIYGWQLAE